MGVVSIVRWLSVLKLEIEMKKFNFSRGVEFDVAVGIGWLG